MIKSYERVKLNTGRKVLTIKTNEFDENFKGSKVLRFYYCLELNNNKINFDTKEERNNFLNNLVDISNENNKSFEKNIAIVLEAEMDYEYLEEFHEGLARVLKDGLYGYIDKTGEEVIRCQFEDANDFHEGLAAVKKDEKWGYIDKTGKEVIRCQFFYAYNFHEGIAVYSGGFLLGNGYIDKTGKKVIKYQVQRANDFHEGLAAVENAEGRGYYIDKTGKEVIRHQFWAVNDFHEGIARVFDGWQYGYIDKNGKEVIKCQFSDAYDFHDGLALVHTVEGWKYIDKNCNEVISIKHDYRSVNDFHEGLALVEEYGRYGYIDKTGKEVIKCQFSDAYDFHDGLARVKKDGLWNYIDKKGKKLTKKIILTSVDDIINFPNNPIITSANKYYTLNFNGNLVYFKTEEERDNFLKQYDNPLIETAKKKIKK